MPLIEVENLSKSFLIHHESKEKYTALRDVIVQKTKKILSFPARLKSNPATAYNEEFWALKDINFNVEAGDRLGIIGRNGAGKSTLLKILSRITPPTKGKITIRGRVASLLEVGTGFHPELTGRENIFLNGAILGMSRVEILKKFDEIVDFAEVEQFLDTPVKRYSSGMYVRLAFAVAAHLEPEILIIDEVLAVGDSQFQKKCLGKLSDLNKNEGRTVIFVSHNLDALRSLCSKGILMISGKLILENKINDCIKLYKNQTLQSNNQKWETINSYSHPHFTSIEVSVEGKQPTLSLKIKYKISFPVAAKPVFIAINIENGLGVTIMQAIPELEPFIDISTCQQYHIIEINLPGLVPDIYGISAWLGPHNSTTYDWQKNIVQFEIIETPSAGRTFPHSTDHGSIVPISKILVK